MAQGLGRQFNLCKRLSFCTIFGFSGYGFPRNCKLWFLQCVGQNAYCTLAVVNLPLLVMCIMAIVQSVYYFVFHVISIIYLYDIVLMYVIGGTDSFPEAFCYSTIRASRRPEDI